jgi:hypothetical protein
VYVFISLEIAERFAERFADPDATMFARLCQGYSLVLRGRVARA